MKVDSIGVAVVVANDDAVAIGVVAEVVEVTVVAVDDVDGGSVDVAAGVGADAVVVVAAAAAVVVDVGDVVAV